MKIAFFSTKSYDRTFFERHNDAGHELAFFEIGLHLNTAKLAEGFEVICVFVNDDLSKSVIKRLAENGVKLIVLRCAGFNNVDLKAAEKHGLKVYRVPAYSPEAVAEHALALILTLSRKTHKAYNRVRENNFSLEKLVGFNLHGKTVGVIGTGVIGIAFCKIMLGMGCKVLAYDIKVNDDLEKLGVEFMELDNLLAKSHIISLHCPLNPATKYLMDKTAFKKMKTGAMLINTSRGGLVNTKDAVKALKAGKLGYLGIDVYEQEGDLFFKDLSEMVIQDDVISRLMTFPNVLITAHQGFFTNEALAEIASVTYQNIADFANGVETSNVVRYNS
jgi:D-lactate dehydrogenase